MAKKAQPKKAEKPKVKVIKAAGKSRAKKSILEKVKEVPSPTPEPVVEAVTAEEPPATVEPPFVEPEKELDSTIHVTAGAQKVRELIVEHFELPLDDVRALLLANRVKVNGKPIQRDESLDIGDITITIGHKSMRFIGDAAPVVPEPEPEPTPFPAIGQKFLLDGTIASIDKKGVISTHQVTNGVITDTPTNLTSLEGHIVEPLSNEVYYARLGS